MNNTQDIHVILRSGAYDTNRVRGNTASSTMSAQVAAERLAQKLFGPALQRVELVDEEATTTLWRAVADADESAWCWASGLIEFGPTVPEAAIEIAYGPGRALRQVVGVAGRHAKPRNAPNQKLLVPGVPEAATQEQGAVALAAWLKWCRQRDTKGSFGVRFCVRLPGGRP